jgi:polyphosphate kinase
MERNLRHRVETLCPILDASLQSFIRTAILDAYLRDNTRAWLLRPDGSYERVSAGTDPSVDAQRTLIEQQASVPGRDELDTP